MDSRNGTSASEELAVKKHGGTITAENRPSGGMRFHLRFPAAEKREKGRGA